MVCAIKMTFAKIKPMMMKTVRLMIQKVMMMAMAMMIGQG